MRKIAKYLLAAVVVAAIGGGAVVIGLYGINPGSVTRPANSQPFAGEPASLLAAGLARHGDTSLSRNGRSCNTCHLETDSYLATFNKPYPHFVQSVRLKTGLDKITAEGMVQFCMVSALGADPLPWDSETLAALTAFVLERHNKVVGQSTRADAMADMTCESPPS